MDRRLHEAIVKGDTSALSKLADEDATILDQKTSGSMNGVLHLAARFGHEEMVAEVVRRRPDLIVDENGEMETPLHEACREGHMGIIKVLLESDDRQLGIPHRGHVYKVNRRRESVLYAASEGGKIDAVKYLIKGYPNLLTLELDLSFTSLHAAATAGYADVAKQILFARPELALKKDPNGCIPLHLACDRGHIDITREFLRFDPDLVRSLDHEGRTSLHWAIARGRVSIIDEILSTSLDFANVITRDDGETILHVAVKNNQYEALKYLVEKIDYSVMLNSPDNQGNTVLHIASAKKLTTMVKYLLKLKVEVNALNHKGYTALDVIEAYASNSGIAIVPALMESGAKRCDQLLPKSRELNPIPDPEPDLDNSLQRWIPQSPRGRLSRNRDGSCRRRRRLKQIEHHMEGLRNARNTIIIAAVLIATVTFSAGINPPGGFDQRTGKAMMGKKDSFLIFTTFNILALFLSLAIVNILVSIIPFKRKSMTKLLKVNHKALWLSTIFMVAAFIAALWGIVPHDGRRKWVAVEIVIIGGGCTSLVFLILGVMLTRHWFRKKEWRKSNMQKRRIRKKPQSPACSNVSSRVEETKTNRRTDNDDESSTDSNMASSSQGYYSL